MESNIDLNNQAYVRVGDKIVPTEIIDTLLDLKMNGDSIRDVLIWRRNTKDYPYAKDVRVEQLVGLDLSGTSFWVRSWQKKFNPGEILRVQQLGYSYFLVKEGNGPREASGAGFNMTVLDTNLPELFPHLTR